MIKPYYHVALLPSVCYNSNEEDIMVRKNTETDFWVKVDKEAPNGCWQWLGTQSGKGYAQWHIRGRRIMVHRYAYEVIVGSIPEGLIIDHLCRNRSCVNTDHMELVTQQENILRGIGLAAKESIATHCPQGHPYDEKNTYVYQGRRYCRACGRERTSNYEKRTKRWLTRKR